MKNGLIYVFAFLFLVGTFVSASSSSEITGCRTVYAIETNATCQQKVICPGTIYEFVAYDSLKQCENALAARDAPGCKNLYWIDDENKSCGQKKFCGAFMYYGLQTFDTKEDCFGASVNCAHLSCLGAFFNETSKKCECGKADEFKTYDLKTFNLSNGRNAEIKIMPEVASEKAIERLGELNFTIELKEVGANQTAYEVVGEKQGKMLGLFKVKANVSMQVDAETGAVLKTKKPWWAFLASGI